MQNLKNCLQNVMFLTSENNQYRYNRLKGGTNAKCSLCNVPVAIATECRANLY